MVLQVEARMEFRMNKEHPSESFRKARRNAMVVDVIVFAIGAYFAYVSYKGFTVSGKSLATATFTAFIAVLTLTLASLLLYRLVKSYRNGNSRSDG